MPLNRLTGHCKRFIAKLTGFMVQNSNLPYTLYHAICAPYLQSRSEPNKCIVLYYWKQDNGVLLPYVTVA